MMWQHINARLDTKSMVQKSVPAYQTEPGLVVNQLVMVSEIFLLFIYKFNNISQVRGIIWLLKNLKYISNSSFTAIRCNELYQPENGYIRYDGRKTTNYGQNVHFGCNHGYRMIGSQTRMCQNINNQAKWSGTQPYCVCKCCKFLIN